MLVRLRASSRLVCVEVIASKFENWCAFGVVSSKFEAGVFCAMAGKFDDGVCFVRWRASSRLVCIGDQIRGWCVFGVMASKFEVCVFAVMRACSRLVCRCDGEQVRGWCDGEQVRDWRVYCDGEQVRDWGVLV